uniref:Uncharacterized protein n=1 Tax=Cacopsylla melanoneura TaxID=428564 RepID=A0A8D8ZDD5_9HEMI
MCVEVVSWIYWRTSVTVWSANPSTTLSAILSVKVHGGPWVRSGKLPGSVLLVETSRNQTRTTFLRCRQGLEIRRTRIRQSRQSASSLLCKTRRWMKGSMHSKLLSTSTQTSLIPWQHQ